MECEQPPNFDEPLHQLREMVTGLAAFLELTQNDDPGRRAPVAFDRAVTIRDLARDTALDVAAHGIATGQLSYRAAADRLRLHPNTLKKRIAERVTNWATTQGDLTELQQNDI